MEKEIKKLKKLGMSSKEAVIFLREIALNWFDKGMSNKDAHLTNTSFRTALKIDIKTPFDTLFSKELAKLSDNGKK